MKRTKKVWARGAKGGDYVAWADLYLTRRQAREACVDEPGYEPVRVEVSWDDGKPARGRRRKGEGR